MPFIGLKFLNRIFELAEKNQVYSFQENKDAPKLFFIPYDNDRFLQFGIETNGVFEFNQRFLAKWRIDTDKLEYLSLKDLPNSILQEEMSLTY